jgi:tetraacyldisaccharide 4'-kinase
MISVLLLWPWSGLFWLGYQVRRMFYRIGLFRARPAGLPVICVGNLAVGGTGKTPFCIALAGYLQEAGFRPAILSRGYRRTTASGPGPTVVSDWEKMLAGPGQAGDEPWLMARKLLGRAIVLTGRDRLRSAARAAEMGADLIIMDDGFQHWRMARDLDIVLLDCRRPLDNGWLLPAGRLREPAAALRRADIVVGTRCGEGPDGIGELMVRQGLKQPHFRTVHRPAGLKPLNGAAAAPAGGRYLLFSGIARPDSFEEGFRSLGHRISRHMAFGDHHNYRPADLERIARAARDSAGVVTTEKDAVKLPREWDPGKPLWALEMEISFLGGGREEMIRIIREALR